jgi:hypothetical protein
MPEQPEPVIPNPRGYPPFELDHVPSYTNRQLRYYQFSRATLGIEVNDLKKRLDERKIALKALEWDGNTPENSRENTPDGSVAPSTHASFPTSVVSRTLSYDDDGEPDSDCPEPVPGRKGVKFNPSDITKLCWNSDVTAYNSWLSDLKSAFRGDPSKFATGELKVIFASMTLDEKLKRTYTTIVNNHPAIATHWRKFHRWAKETVLHGDSKRQERSKEFTRALQRVEEDPNEFYLRLLNLAVQAGRSLAIDDYRTRLVPPLQNLLDMQELTYQTVEDVVAHAGRKWHLLTPAKIRREIKEAREDRFERNTDRTNQQPRGRASGDRGRDQGQRGQRHQGQRPRQDHNRQERQPPRLSSDEEKHRRENHLCYNCGRPDHQSRDCDKPHNPNRVQPRRQDDDQTKSQPLRGHQSYRPNQKRPHVRAQPTRASDRDDNNDHDVHTTDGSDEDRESDRAAKRSKND